MSGRGSSGPPADDGSGSVRIHEPVLLPESLAVMDLAPGMTIVDGTLGAGGHAAAFARALGPDGVLVGLDRDAEILGHARATLCGVGGGGGGPRIELRHASYAEIGAVLSDLGLEACDRAFLDLGVSSFQLDSPHRGFSFMRDGPLDMRMDPDRTPRSAADWLGDTPVEELERVLRDYGGERFAGRIARAIVDARGRAPLSRTGHLADLVVRATPAKFRHGRIHVATRTFQAVRMAVNDEVGGLERGLAACWKALRPGGRLAVISFHSLEARLVKRFLREHGELVVKKPITAGPAEIARNSRARSAQLRAAIKREVAA